MSARTAIESARLAASGFSQKVGRPRAMAARMRPGWSSVDTQMMTASAPSRASSTVRTADAAQLRATAAARSVTTSMMMSRSSAPWRAASVRAVVRCDLRRRARPSPAPPPPSVACRPRGGWRPAGAPVTSRSSGQQHTAGRTPAAPPSGMSARRPRLVPRVSRRRAATLRAARQGCPWTHAPRASTGRRTVRPGVPPTWPAVASRPAVDACSRLATAQWPISSVA